MFMFSHIMVGANNVEEAKKFYDAVLGALSIEPGVMDPKGRCFYRTPSGIFAITPNRGSGANSSELRIRHGCVLR